MIEGQVKTVDEQTGQRMMEGQRRDSDGLHQALEAKENIKTGDTQLGDLCHRNCRLQELFPHVSQVGGAWPVPRKLGSQPRIWEIYKLDIGRYSNQTKPIVSGMTAKT